MLLKRKTTILAIFAFALLIWVFSMIHYLNQNGYISKTFRESFFRESFASFDKYFRPNNPEGPLVEGPDTTHTVSLPLNTTTTCENKCSTTGVCYITGEQCIADLDCYGCTNPNSKIVGMNYNSSLTSNFSDSSEIITQNQNSTTPKTSNGVDDWTKQAQQGQDLFNQRYKQDIPDLPSYMVRTSLTGEFLENGPIPGNYIPMPPNPPNPHSN